MAKYIQTPPQGKHCLLHCGDLLEFRIESDSVIPGTACLMTNLGNAAWKRAETIANVEEGVTRSFQDWHNVRMNKIDDYTFSLSLMLTEEGHFEAKCYIEHENDGEPLWIEGENVHINVEPATYCCSNSIYCAFVRQFGPNRTKSVTVPPDPETAAVHACGHNAQSGILVGVAAALKEPGALDGLCGSIRFISVRRRSTC